MLVCRLLSDDISNRAWAEQIVKKRLRKSVGGLRDLNVARIGLRRPRARARAGSAEWANGKAQARGKYHQQLAEAVFSPIHVTGSYRINIPIPLARRDRSVSPDFQAGGRTCF